MGRKNNRSRKNQARIENETKKMIRRLNKELIEKNSPKKSTKEDRN